MENNCEEVKKSLDNVIEGVNNFVRLYNELYQFKNVEKKDEVELLRKTNDALARRISELTDLVKDLERQRESWKTQYRNLDEKLAEAEKRLEQYEVGNKVKCEYEEAIHQFRNDIAYLTNSVVEKNREITALEHQLRNYERAYKDTSEKVTSLKAELERQVRINQGLAKYFNRHVF